MCVNQFHRRDFTGADHLGLFDQARVNEIVQ
jgi:hypothetical protein